MIKNAANEQYIRFFNNIYKLKNLVRRGWEIRGIDSPESVADHSFGIATLAMVLGPRANLDMNRMVPMALVHDIGEAIVGDIVPSDEIPTAEKEQRELEAMRTILKDVDKDGFLLGLWEEYTAGLSREAQYVKELDKLEMALQASHYEHEQDRDLDEFFASAEDRIKHDELSSLLLSVIETRKS
jgi:putative hydrolase of HD superfamily